MCYYYAVNKTTGDLELHYRTRWVHTIKIIQAGYQKGFDYPAMPMISNDDRALRFGQWGILPANLKTPEEVKDYRIKFTGALNAKLENIYSSPLWSKFAENRCLIPASEFMEWRHEIIPGKKTPKKIPYDINGETEIFSIAGLYSDWVSPEGETIRTFAIITTKANEIMRYVHNSKERMPLILKPEDEKAWLDGEKLEKFAFPYSATLLAFAQ